ncbi:50S ribosomal protein L5 [Orientia chuto str. Dubai]|uniref:Large ribosomal subunit protein uL5 n=1 Tax=Orientia chuto str. Dubai TaxID=1359168 RepID=A0A0F3MIG2_9RICK|nr:50S ribosomal protein L5 [Candidatus Orientia mediorientalis]KJV55252.1 50S ribosomal protein L5 [Orientia chuto str. Dubai]
MALSFKELSLKEIREKDIQELQKQFNYSNFYQIPRIKKVIANICIKDAVADSKIIYRVKKSLAMITGQEPVLIKAKKSIAAFKLREGMLIACKVTLRRKRAEDFIRGLVLRVFPRIKGFKGFSIKSCDQSGNFSFGVKDIGDFIEMDDEVKKKDMTDKEIGMNVNIETSAKSSTELRALLRMRDVPFYD